MLTKSKQGSQTLPTRTVLPFNSVTNCLLSLAPLIKNIQKIAKYG